MRLISLLVIVLLAPIPASAQTSTPWGDPDLQGVWTNQTPVPLERPQALAGKAFFTEEESAEFERTALTRLLGVVADEVPVSGELNEVWLETSKGRSLPSRRTSLIVDPPDGKIPYTPEGRRRWNAVPSLEKATREPLAANGPEDRAESERCLTTGGLFVPNPFYGNYHQIVQTEGYVAILTELMHEQTQVGEPAHARDDALDAELPPQQRGQQIPRSPSTGPEPARIQSHCRRQ